MDNSAYFIWKDSALKKVDSETYDAWCKHIWHQIKPDDFAHNQHGIQRSIEIVFDGYVDFYEDGMQVFPFTLLFFEDHLDNSKFHDADFIENFTTLDELRERREEISQMILSGKVFENSK